MCKDMPVSVKVYYGSPTSAVEIRRFIFRPEQYRQGSGIYNEFRRSLSALFNGLDLRDVNLCWKDDDGDYVIFSSDDELRVAITNTTDNTLRVYIKEKELPGRVVGGASGSSNSAAAVNHTSTGSSVVMATNSSTRRCNDQERYHRHHYPHRRTGRQDSSCRDKHEATSSNTIVRHHRTTTAAVTGDNLAKDMTDQLHLNDEVLTVAVDNPSSPRMSNHVGAHGRLAPVNDELCRDPSTSAAVSLATAAASSSAVSAPDTVCSECRGEGRGVWYRCTVCNEFYLCSECENRGLHDQHIMVRTSSASVSRHGTNQYYVR